VIRTRLTLDRIGRYSGLADCMAKMVRYEGAGALYRGLAPSLSAIIPEAAITYGMFDLLKGAHARVTGQEAGVAAALAFGVSSAFLGQVHDG
jgi:solute carrier family 25 (mitochondrial phosphate transporter), member 23/24/25/41